MESNPIILETKNLTRIVNKNGKSKTIIDNITMKFERGLIYSIIGPSGAGKSSFLRLLNRLDQPTSGSILFNRQSVESYPPTALRQKISLLFQTPYLFEGTVRSNLEYCCGLKDSVYHLDILNQVGLSEDYLDRDVADLSIGEKQRVAIGRSLVQNPEILLLDEPTSALDPAYSRKIEELIASLSKDLGLTVLIVTHNPQQALTLGGWSLLLVKGQLIECAPTEELLNSPKSELGQKYIRRELT